MKDLNTNLLRHPQRQQLQDDIAQSENMLPRANPDDQAVMRKTITRSRKQLESQSPEPLTGKEKDTLAALEKKLRNRITHNMPTEEVMRKNPPGAVDWHVKWEKADRKSTRLNSSHRL